MKTNPIEPYFNLSTSRSGVLIKDNLLAYLSNESGINQIHLKNLETGDEKQLTFLENRVWSLFPETLGNKLFFTSDIGGNEQEQIFSVDIETGVCKNITNKPQARFNFGGILPDGKTIIGSSTLRNPANYDLVEISIEDGSSKIILENSDNYNMPADLSPNGRYLLYNKMKGISENTLWIFDRETSEAYKIHPEGEFAQYINPCWKKDSSGFFLLTDYDSNFVYIAYVDLSSNTLEPVYKPLWDVDAIALSDDDRYLAMCINEDGYGKLEILDTVLNQHVNCPIPPKGFLHSYLGFAFATESHRLVFGQMSVKRPGNVWMLDLDNDSLTKLTDTIWNDMDKDLLIEPSLHRFSSFDGLSVPYWLYQKHDTPSDAPVILEIHGGPEGQEWPIYNPFLSYLVNEGFVIVAPNVRGSTGYGKEYHHLDDIEKRLDSIHDVEQLVKHLIDTGIAKEGSIGIMGTSYGGFMTLSGITEYPHLFSAAIDTVGMSDLETFLENTAEYRRSHRESEYGSLANHRDVLRKVSPIHKVDRIVTPLMVVHGANDPRVPVTEAEQIVASLNNRGISVEFLCYEDEGHGLSKRVNQIDCYTKASAFLKKHLAPKA